MANISFSLYLSIHLTSFLEISKLIATIKKILFILLHQKKIFIVLLFFFSKMNKILVFMNTFLQHITEKYIVNLSTYSSSIGSSSTTESLPLLSIPLTQASRTSFNFSSGIKLFKKSN